MAEALAKSTLDVTSIAKDIILQQQRAMVEKSTQLESAVEVRVQSDAVAARLALANAEHIMFQENAKELKRGVDLHHQTHTAREAIYEEKLKVLSQAWEQFQRLQIYQENGIKELAVE